MAVGGAAHFVGGCVLRNSSRALTARSKMSGGTISPRIVFARFSSCVRHSGPVALVTVRPVLGHQRDGARVLLRHLDPQPLLDAGRRGQQLRPVGLRNRVPRLRRDDGGADDRREAEVEHVRRLPVPLEQHRRERRRRQPVDHAGREPGQDVGHRHRARLEAVRLVPLHHPVVAGRRVELDALEIVHRLHGLLGEHLHPPAVAPVEQHEALRLDPLPDDRRQLVGDVVQLVVRVEEERDVEDVEGRSRCCRGRRRVNDAACSASSRILRSTVGSSPCEPPLKTVTVTRPSVACFHSSPICFRFLSQTEPSGTTVASLTVVCARDGVGG